MNKLFKTPKLVDVYNRPYYFANQKPDYRHIIHKNASWIGLGIDYCEGESYGYTIAIVKLQNGDIATPRVDQLQVINN